MKRLLFFPSMILALALPAQACDMTTSARSNALVEYVENGLDCLENPPEPLRFDPHMEQLFLDRVNQERRKAGLNALKVRPEMLPAARFHSLDFGHNRYFQHQGPDGRNAGNRIAAFDRTLLAQSTAENIAAFGPAICYDQFENEVSCFLAPGFKLPTQEFVVEDLHKKLMLSDGHRANILAEDSTHIAIGVARQASGFYVTQVFTNQVGSLSEPLPVGLKSNRKLDVEVEITGWDFSTFAATSPGEERIELNDGQLDTLPAGQQMLLVRGENISSEKRGGRTYTTTEWMDLFGPAFTIETAKGS
ncbi:MAG: CAP domain-containing protein [Henriciella sp.]